MTADQIETECIEGLAQHLRVRWEEIGRGDDIQQLSIREADKIFVVGCHAFDLVHSFVPPLFTDLESAVKGLERLALPFLGLEAFVLICRVGIGELSGGQILPCPLQSAESEFRAFAGIECQMESPVPIGKAHGNRRNPQAQVAEPGIADVIQDLQGLGGGLAGVAGFHGTFLLLRYSI